MIYLSHVELSYTILKGTQQVVLYVMIFYHYSIPIISLHSQDI